MVVLRGLHPLLVQRVTPPLNDTWPYAIARAYYVEKDDAQKALDKLDGYGIRGRIVDVEAEYCRVDPPFLPWASRIRREGIDGQSF